MQNIVEFIKEEMSNRGMTYDLLAERLFPYRALPIYARLFSYLFEKERQTRHFIQTVSHYKFLAFHCFNYEL